MNKAKITFVAWYWSRLFTNYAKCWFLTVFTKEHNTVLNE